MSISFSLNLHTGGPEVTVHSLLYVSTDGFVNIGSSMSHKHTIAHTRSHPVSRWLWGQKVTFDSISTKVILALLLLSYSNINLPIWHLDIIFWVSLSPSPLLPFSFSLPGQNTAIITLFYFLRFNAQHSTLTALFFFFFKCLFVLLRLSSFILSWLPRSDRTNNATGVSLNVATHRPSAGCLGDQITINFQLKQTKRWQLRVRGTRQEAVLIYDKWA